MPGSILRFGLDRSCQLNAQAESLSRSDDQVPFSLSSVGIAMAGMADMRPVNFSNERAVEAVYLVFEAHENSEPGHVAGVECNRRAGWKNRRCDSKDGSSIYHLWQQREHTLVCQLEVSHV
jgi:hypothetical protein